MNTKIIAIVNNKGGQGKTTTANAIGAALTASGEKVLLIDLDPQGNLTESLLAGEPELTIADTLESGAALPIYPLPDGTSLTPSYFGLAEAEAKLTTNSGRVMNLKKALEPIKGKYSYIIIDCAPHLGALTYNALAASTDVFVPLTAEALSYSGLQRIKSVTEAAKEQNPALNLSGIIITRWENTSINKEIEALLREEYGSIVFNTKIRKNVTLQETPLAKLNIFEYDKHSNGAKDYKALVTEILNR